MKSTSKIFVLFIFLLSMTSFLGAVNYETSYSAEILEVEGKTLAPDRLSDFWRSVVTCSLDNGLVASMERDFLYESQAIDEINFQKNQLSGTAYVIERPGSLFEKGFFILRLLNQDYEEEVKLHLDESLDIKSLPYLTAITENIDTRLILLNQYKYVLTFSDGSIWETDKRKTRWENPWTVNTRILYVNGKKQPGIINVDQYLAKKTTVKTKHCLSYYFNQYKRMN